MFTKISNALKWMNLINKWRRKQIMKEYLTETIMVRAIFSTIYQGTIILTLGSKFLNEKSINS